MSLEGRDRFWARVTADALPRQCWQWGAVLKLPVQGGFVDGLMTVWLSRVTHRLSARLKILQGPLAKSDASGKRLWRGRAAIRPVATDSRTVQTNNHR